MSRSKPPLPPDSLRIAIVGSGISGLTAAYYLSKQHRIEVFEKGHYLGGHTNTIDLALSDGDISVDTGFIVHNDRTYPNFLKLINKLEVPTQNTEMSFSLKDEVTGMEYNGGSLNKIFAQRSNLLRPRFYQMLQEILRFNRTAKSFMEMNDTDMDLGDFLKHFRFKQIFIDKYLIPMGASIWSTVPQDMLKYPAHAFIRFFHHHGLLDLQNRPQWRSIPGGAREYVKRITKDFSDKVHLNHEVTEIIRHESGAQLRFKDGTKREYDEVILACHSDQALQLLKEPSYAEIEILGAIPYQENIAILHTDASVLPQRKLAWASWNYHLTEDTDALAALTYQMNILQLLNTQETVNVTLNRQELIDPEKIHRIISYQHPLFTREGLIAQNQKNRISGVNHTWFCGAYWHNGFHEDGVVSALDVIRGLGGEPL